MEDMIANLPPWLIKAGALVLGLLIALAALPLLLRIRRKTTERPPQD